MEAAEKVGCRRGKAAAGRWWSGAEDEENVRKDHQLAASGEGWEKEEMIGERKTKKKKKNAEKNISLLPSRPLLWKQFPCHGFGLSGEVPSISLRRAAVSFDTGIVFLYRADISVLETSEYFPLTIQFRGMLGTESQ